MSKNKLSGFTTAELKSVHEDSFGNDYNIKEAFGLNKTEYRNNGADGTRKRPTRRQAKKDLEKTFGVYENKEADNWRKVRESMGIKDVNSNSDFAAMKREVSMEMDRRSNEKATAGLRDRLTELENRPAPEAKPEAPEKKGPKSYIPEDPNRPRPPSSPEDKIGGTPAFDASKYDWAKRMGGAEAPGQAEYVKAKEKAQAYKSPEYSFEGGSYGDQPESGADQYGNVTPEKMDAEHKAEQLKNSHVEKAKAGGGGIRTMEFRDSDGNGIDDRDDGTPKADEIRRNRAIGNRMKYPG